MSKFTRAEERNLGKTFSYMLVVIYQREMEQPHPYPQE